MLKIDFDFRWNRHPLMAVLSNHSDKYPTASNLSYFWGFGSAAGFALVAQLISGIFLAMHYTPETTLAFLSIEHIMRDVNDGYILRYVHANGASMFFLVVYLHIFRGLYYGSFAFPRMHLWLSGSLLFVLMMATGFMGYVLPWGQMSFWGATVITNLFSAIPAVGESIVLWLWGGFSVDNATLNRFFSLHYLLPFAIAGLALAHLALLHLDGSGNPLGVESKVDKISFYPYFYFKDLFGLLVFFTLYSFFVFYEPNVLGHPDNYIEADPMVTPAHIVPEWYFLPFYAILRSIPDKLGGVIAMGGAIVCLMLMPLLTTSEIRSCHFKPFQRILFWFIFFDFIILGWLGQKPVEDPYIALGQLAAVFYFAYFLILTPVVGEIENALADEALLEEKRIK
jgi:quinol-cytochrome oxidoreductase complex cytochrome b subunit